MGEESRPSTNAELQDDFSVDQTLSLYVLEMIPLLHPEFPTCALDLLTLVESIPENPELILRCRLDKLKGEAVAQMKTDGWATRGSRLDLPGLQFAEHGDQTAGGHPVPAGDRP